MESIKEFLVKYDLLGFLISAVISIILGLIYKGIKSFVMVKRKAYNISRQLISHMVYDNRRDGDFSITVAYKGNVYNDSLTMTRIRLSNDGENDILFNRQCAKPILIEIINADIIEVYVECVSDQIDATVSKIRDNNYNLSWNLLKRDEYVDLVVVAKGKDFNNEQVRMDIRAEGISRIKSPEYHVWPQLWPILVASIIMATILWYTTSNRITFIPMIPENVFWTLMIFFILLWYIIIVLIKRIKWEKE